MNEHLMQRVEALSYDKAMLLIRLKGLAIIGERFNSAKMLSLSELTTLKAAQALIAEIEAQEAA